MLGIAQALNQYKQKQPADERTAGGDLLPTQQPVTSVTPSLETQIGDAYTAGQALEKDRTKVQGVIDTSLAALAKASADGNVKSPAEIQLEGETAAAQSERDLMQKLGPLKEDYTPMQVPGQYPRMGAAPPIPQRGRPQVNPFASLLGAVAGFAVPQSASHLAWKTLQGGIEKANQTYQDALHTRDLQLADLHQRHQDDLGQRNEMIRIIEGNYEGLNKIKALNALHDHNWKELKNQIESRLKGLKKVSELGAGQSPTVKKLLELQNRIDVAESGRKELDTRIDKVNSLSTSLQGLKERRDAAADHAETQRQAAHIHQLEQELNRSDRKENNQANRELRKSIHEDTMAMAQQRINLHVSTDSGLSGEKKMLEIEKLKQELGGKWNPKGSPKAQIGQLRDQQKQLHTDVDNLFKARRVYMTKWKVDHPDGTTKEMFADPEYKNVYEAPEVEARQQLNTVQTAIDDIRGGKSTSMPSPSASEPSRPEQVPKNYIYKEKGPKGAGWYRP